MQLHPHSRQNLSVEAATTSAVVSRWLDLRTHAAATSPAATGSLLFEDLPLHHNFFDRDGPPFGHLLSHTPSSLEEVLHLHLPYQKNVLALANIEELCAWRHPTETALHSSSWEEPRERGQKNEKTKNRCKCIAKVVGRLCPSMLSRVSRSMLLLVPREMLWIVFRSKLPFVIDNP